MLVLEVGGGGAPEGMGLGGLCNGVRGLGGCLCTGGAEGVDGFGGDFASGVQPGVHGLGGVSVLWGVHTEVCGLGGAVQHRCIFWGGRALRAHPQSPEAAGVGWAAHRGGALVGSPVPWGVQGLGVQGLGSRGMRGMHVLGCCVPVPGEVGGGVGALCSTVHTGGCLACTRGEIPL